MKPLTLRLISAFCLWSVFVFAELRFLPKTSNERLQTDFVLFLFTAKSDHCDFLQR